MEADQTDNGKSEETDNKKSKDRMTKSEEKVAIQEVIIQESEPEFEEEPESRIDQVVSFFKGLFR